MVCVLTRQIKTCAVSIFQIQYLSLLCNVSGHGQAFMKYDKAFLLGWFACLSRCLLQQLCLRADLFYYI